MRSVVNKNTSCFYPQMFTTPPPPPKRNGILVSTAYALLTILLHYRVWTKYRCKLTIKCSLIK